MTKFTDNLSRWILSNFLYIWLFLVLLIAALVGIAFVKLPLSDAIQALFLAIQSMLMFVLVLVTWWYARETAKMSKSSSQAAKAAAEQAEASKKMGEEMRQQRLSASQPVVWPSIWGWDSGEDRLVFFFENIGNGPALDIDIFLGRGKDPIIRDCEHKWYSYIIAGDTKKNGFLELPDSISRPLGPETHDKIINWQRGLVGEYALLVEWRDIYMSGPFFQAKLSFIFEIDSRGRPVAKEGLVNVVPISAKKKPT